LRREANCIIRNYSLSLTAENSHLVWNIISSIYDYNNNAKNHIGLQESAFTYEEVKDLSNVYFMRYNWR